MRVMSDSDDKYYNYEFDEKIILILFSSAIFFCLFLVGTNPNFFLIYFFLSPFFIPSKCDIVAKQRKKKELFFIEKEGLSQLIKTLVPPRCHLSTFLYIKSILLAPQKNTLCGG